MTPSEPVTALAFFKPIPLGSSGGSPDQTRIGSPYLAFNPAVNRRTSGTMRLCGWSMILFDRSKSGKLILIKLQAEFGDSTEKLGDSVLADRLDQVIAHLETVARLHQLAIGVGRGHLLACQ